MSSLFVAYLIFSTAQSRLCRSWTYQSIVFRKPSSKGTQARNPNSRSARLTSSFRRGCPFGLLVSQTILPVNPVIRWISSTNSFMLISRLLPRFTGSALSYSSVANRMASAASSRTEILVWASHHPNDYQRFRLRLRFRINPLNLNLSLNLALRKFRIYTFLD